MFYRPLGTTGLKISPIGFGGYRIADEAEEHKVALEYALRSGFNLIDTSANYTDGSSEILVGSTLLTAESAEATPVEKVVVVTKGGYIQGKNYDIAVVREEKFEPFPDVVKYAPGLWHCIHPEFLEDQINRSLDRLQMDTIDLYLLHNPEYFLEDAAHRGVGMEEARAAFYGRIDKAFRHLEYEVLQNRIRRYGISSNNFATLPGDASHVSLERVRSIAKAISPANSFAAIQCPLNLCEHAAATLRNQENGTKTLFAYAHEHGIAVLTNRPLNAFYRDRLIRLTEPPSYTEISEEQANAAIESFVQAESAMRQTLASVVVDLELREMLPENFAIGEYLRKHRHTLTSGEQFNELYARHFHPRFVNVRHIVSEGEFHTTSMLDVRVEEQDQIKALFNEYRAAYRNAMETVAAYLSRKTRDTNLRMHGLLAQVWKGKHSELSLSQKSLLAILTTPGVDAALLGMRRAEYVDDALDLFGAVPEDAESFAWDEWAKLIKNISLP